MELAGDARVAAYYAPAATDPLWLAGSRWIGRDALSGARQDQPPLPGLAAATLEPCGYGFHATLKAPILLRPGITWPHVLQRARALCRGLAPFDLPKLAVGEMNGLLALLQTTPCPPLNALSDTMVAGFDDFRPPLGERELARRRALQLSAAQEAMLQRWGYPDVFATWRFHMTLTQRLPPEQRALYLPIAADMFADACAQQRHIDSLCLFVQPSQHQPFRLVERIPFGACVEP